MLDRPNILGLATLVTVQVQALDFSLLFQWTVGGARGVLGLLMEANRKGSGAAQTLLQEMEERTVMDQRKRGIYVKFRAAQVTII